MNGGKVTKMQWPQKIRGELLGGIHRIAHHLDAILRLAVPRQRDALAKSGPVLIGGDTGLDAIVNRLTHASYRIVLGAKSRTQKPLYVAARMTSAARARCGAREQRPPPP